MALSPSSASSASSTPRRRSVRFEEQQNDSDKKSTDTLDKSTASSSSHGLRGRLMREHVKDRDPLFYYEVLSVVGVGSMGSVATVRKRDEVVGGSSRQNLVDSFRREEKLAECFRMPLLGPLFRFCVEDVGIVKSHSYTSRHGGHHASDSDDNSASTRSFFSSLTLSKRDLFTESERTALSAEESSSHHHPRSKYQVTYAMKSIHLNRITDESFIQELQNEIEILKQLDHPHIVRPIETFNHRNQLFIVMELCAGGDLYARDPYTEEEAARIVSSILSAVSYMHLKGVVHRDLKFENVLFVNESPRAEIKLIDFGLSKTYISKDEALTDGVGTIYTMAPEVLKGSYTSQADLWSVGVIAYMLLSSQMPFYGRKRRHIVEQIMDCNYDFSGRRWKRVSKQAKAFVEDLLVEDPDERLTAEEASGSTWLNRRFAATVRGPTEEEMESTTSSLTTYANYTKLKKLALMVVAHKSTSEEIGILRKVFEKYDTSRNGSISQDEFKVALETYGYTDEEVERMFAGLDVDGTGEVKYCEFLAATIEAQGAISEERLAEAFDRLDSDDSGFISKENLREFLGDDMPQDEIDEIIREVDENNDNKISFPEFLALWEDKNEEKRANMMDSLRAHRATLSSSSYGGFSSVHSVGTDSSTATQQRDDLKSDSESDHCTLARANYIEGKQMSERNAKKYSKCVGGAATKVFITATEDDIPTGATDPIVAH